MEVMRVEPDFGAAIGDASAAKPIFMRGIVQKSAIGGKLNPVCIC